MISCNWCDILFYMSLLVTNYYTSIIICHLKKLLRKKKTTTKKIKIFYDPNLFIYFFENHDPKLIVNKIFR